MAFPMPSATTSARRRARAPTTPASWTTSPSSPPIRRPSASASSDFGIKPRNRYFAQFKLYQSFIADPNGLMIELNFHGIEKEPDWGDSENYAQMPRVDA